MKNTIVVDLDGTLADVGHRRHWVLGKKRNYEAFHSELHKDPVNEPVRKLMTAMAATGHRVVIVSARPKHVQEATIAWLEHHGIAFDQCFLIRATGDSTPDQELKRIWLNAYGKDRILFVVDDRQKVVDMWRAEGMTCLQCDAWLERPNA